MSVLTLDPFEYEQRRERTLWTIVALVVGGLHVGLAVGYLLLRPAPQGRAQAPAFDVVFTPAVVSEPAPTAQDAPASEPPPVEPPKDEPVKDDPVAREAVAEPVPPAPSEPEPQVMAQPEPVPDVIPSPEPAPKVALAPEPPRADDVVLPPPPPPPKPIEAIPPEPKPVPVPERVERKPVEKKERAERKPAPPKPAAAPAARPSRVASAPNPGEDSVGAREGQASWNAEVVAQIRRAAAYPSDGNGASGTVMLNVVIDRNGRLLSRRLAGSSGSPALDRAAMGIIERAAPFPRFPPAMAQAQVSRTVPLHLRPR